MQAYIGEIRLFGFDYPPEDWAPCDGQKLEIDKFQALYSVIGTIYGGSVASGIFMLPNLNGRAAMGTGAGPDLTSRALSDETGSASVTLESDDLARHRHSVAVYVTNDQTRMTADPSSAAWLSRYIVKGSTSIAESYSTAKPDTSLSGASVGYAGGDKNGLVQPHENRQPFLAMNYCICLNGDYPARP